MRFADKNIDKYTLMAFICGNISNIKTSTQSTNRRPLPTQANQVTPLAIYQWDTF